MLNEQDVYRNRQRYAFLTGRQVDAVEELARQLSEARYELQQVRFERLLAEVKYEAYRADHDTEINEMRIEMENMRQEFLTSIAQLNELRSLVFMQWSPTDHEMVN